MLAAAFAFALSSSASAADTYIPKTVLEELLRTSFSQFCIPKVGASCSTESTPTFVEASTTPNKCQCDPSKVDTMVYDIEDRECKFCQLEEHCQRASYVEGEDNCTKHKLGSVGNFATACNPCPTGTYKSSLTTCSLCRNGTFTPQPGLDRCEVCPPRTYTSHIKYTLQANGTHSEEPLPVGKEYEDNKKECLEIPDGFQVLVNSYCDTDQGEILITKTNYSSCKPNTTRHYNAGPASTLPCRHYVDETLTDVEMYPKDLWKNQGDPAQGLVTELGNPPTGTCKTLTTGHRINIHRNGEESCQPGESARVEVDEGTHALIFNTCYDCDGATFSNFLGVNGGQGIGNYDETDAHGCTELTPGHSLIIENNKRIGEEACGVGYFANAGTTQCTARSTGYRLEGCNGENKACTGQVQCDSGTYASSITSYTSCGNCSGRTYSKQGESGKEPIDDSCHAADNGYIVASDHKSQIECPLGQYVDAAANNNRGACVARSTGYVVNSDRMGQTQCVSGQYVKKDASPEGENGKCMSCDAGTFSDTSIPYGNGAVRDIGCDICEGDTYSASAGASACTPCPAGKVILFENTDDRFNHDSSADCKVPSCPDGSSWGTGMDASGNCPAGYKKTDVESSCPSGFYRVDITSGT
jgi:hypothetical protein